MSECWRAAVGLVFVAGCAKPAPVASRAVPKPLSKVYDAQGYVLIGDVEPSAVAQARYALNGAHVHARVEDPPGARVWVRPDETESGIATLLESSRGKYRFRTSRELPK